MDDLETTIALNEGHDLWRECMREWGQAEVDFTMESELRLSQTAALLTIASQMGWLPWLKDIAIALRSGIDDLHLALSNVDLAIRGLADASLPSAALS